MFKFIYYSRRWSIIFCWLPIIAFFHRKDYCRNYINRYSFLMPDKTFQLPLSSRRISWKYALVHLGYWVLVTGFFIYEKKYLIHKASLPYFILCVSVRVILLMVIAYLNLHFFLPRYLLYKRYLSYATALVLSVLAYLAAQGLFDYFLYGYVIGPMRNSDLLEALSYNFFSTLWYIGLMLALKLSIDWYSQQVLIQKITVEKLNAELGFLRAQVNPHFLFNILNNLYALTLKQSPQAPDVVLKLSGMMEYMLYDSSGEKVSLKKEIMYLENYIDLEKLRFSGEVGIEMEVDQVDDKYEIAPLLMLPLVENAFKHGLGRHPAMSWMKVSVAFHDPVLTLVVENSKPAGSGQARDVKPKIIREAGGGPPDREIKVTGATGSRGNQDHTLPGTTSSRGGIGLENLRKRLDLLYPGKYNLVLGDGDLIYTAELSINLSQK